MRKVFYNVCAVIVVAGFFGGCGGGGDPASGGVADAVVMDNGASGSTDSVGSVGDSLPTDEDTAVASDTSVGNDLNTGDTIDYPEPGSVEYWVGIIPGVWEEKPCVEFDSEDCTTTLSIVAVPDSMTSKCPDSKYVIAGKASAINGICLEEKGVLSLSKGDASWGFEASGALEEKIVANGTCDEKTDNPRQCVRSSDCADLTGAPQCKGMQVEYWMTFCSWYPEVGVCGGEISTRHFQKVQ